MIWLTTLLLFVSALSPHKLNLGKVGSDTYGEIAIESLDILGAVKFNGTTVNKLLKVTGNLNARDASLHEVEAEGNVHLMNTSVANEIRVTGALQAEDSSFQQLLAFTGQKALFSKCRLAGITIKRDPAFKAKQVISLKNTIVEGPIVFEGGGGEVLLYPGSKVGSVTGGKVSHKN